MFTDKEYRIFLSAMEREEIFCGIVDKELVREPYEINLVDICRDIKKKVHDAQHKYCWHDIRKNPNDLPEKGVRVEIAVIDKETGQIEQHRHFTTYGLPNPFGGKLLDAWVEPYQYFFYGNEIALWRYPEPIEEGFDGD